MNNVFLSSNHKALDADNDLKDYLYHNVSCNILRDRYCMPGESIEDIYARVATAYGDDTAHAERLYAYMTKFWFSPSTPILSNGGTTRGLPISCFLNESSDNLSGIVDVWNENVWLATSGGGIGTYWGSVRSIGESVKGCGKTSGIIPFIKVMDSLTLAISQGSLRRGSAAVYIDIHHPEIEEFLEIRKPAGDFNRRSLNLHHGILIDDQFMHAVSDDKMYDLRSPKDNRVVKSLSARYLWQKVLETRVQTGEPYIVFSDHVNNNLCDYQRKLGLRVKTSNLCSEITLPTGLDYNNQQRTAVCCLSSLNLHTINEWGHEKLFIEDILRMLDNVMDDFIARAPSVTPFLKSAVYSAGQERSVGLGVMGLHYFFQKNMIPMDSPLARSWNMKFFQHLKREADRVSNLLADEKGACPDAIKMGRNERFSHKLAVAPTASISLISGCVSPSIEPVAANIYTHKTLSGSFTIKNIYLSQVFKKSGISDDVWYDILENQGSVAYMQDLNDHMRAVFKTAFEVNQFALVDLVADRTPYICQAQSFNVFLNSTVEKHELLMLHWQAWKKGVKSMYYCRSRAMQNVAFASHKNGDSTSSDVQYEECATCQ